MRSIAEWTRERIASALVMVVVAAVPLWLAREHWRARWPWSGDAVSMVLPTAIARRRLAAGELPLWSPLYFQGESLLTPHSQLLYPPWWLTFLPLPLGDALKLVIGLHFVAAPLVVYWYGRRAGLPVPIAAGIAIAAALPLARLSWHHQKTLGWPWLLWIAGQLLPWEWENARRSGFVIGLSGGAMVLASSLYFAWYGAVLVAPLFLLYRDWDRWRTAIAGALVGVPAIVLNVLPYLGTSRPDAGWFLTPRTLLAGLTGLGRHERTIVQGYQIAGVPFEGYAVVGVVVVLLGVAGLVAAVRDGRHRWATAIVASALAGLVLAMHPLVYRLPVVGAFRTAGRANVILALVLLTLAIYACRAAVARADDLWAIVARRHELAPGVSDRNIHEDPGSERTPTASQIVVGVLSVLVLANAVLGAAVWEATDGGDGTDLAESRDFAASLPERCGDEVWVEMYGPNSSVPRGHLGMALLDAGYTLDAVYFAAFGASYQVRGPSGTLSFDLLLSPDPIREPTPLTGGSAQRVRGTVRPDELRLLDTREYRGETLYVYARTGACS